MSLSRFSSECVDSAHSLTNQISRDLGYYRAVVVFIVLLYGTKVGLGLLSDLYVGFKTFILPKILGQPDFVKKYGKWAAVTGCTAGIGRSYANELAKRGMNLVLISISKEELDKVSNEIRVTFNVETIIIVADFAKNDDSIYEKIYNSITASKIDLGVLVNNVGIQEPYPRPMLESTSNLLNRMINVNAKAATLLSNKLLPQMLKNKRGAVINISSICGTLLLPNTAVYGSTKAYMDYFTKVVSLEYPKSDSGVTFQLITPGTVDTNMTKLGGVDEKVRSSIFGASDSTFFPSSDRFAASALSTLGYSSNTTGYWGHSLQMYCLSFMPAYILKPAFNKGTSYMYTTIKKAMGKT